MFFAIINQLVARYSVNSLLFDNFLYRNFGVRSGRKCFVLNLHRIFRRRHLLHYERHAFFFLVVFSALILLVVQTLHTRPTGLVKGRHLLRCRYPRLLLSVEIAANRGTCKLIFVIIIVRVQAQV